LLATGACTAAFERWFVGTLDRCLMRNARSCLSKGQLSFAASSAGRQSATVNMLVPQVVFYTNLRCPRVVQVAAGLLKNIQPARAFSIAGNVAKPDLR